MRVCVSSYVIFFLFSIFSTGVMGFLRSMNAVMCGLRLPIFQ